MKFKDRVLTASLLGTKRKDILEMIDKHNALVSVKKGTSVEEKKRIPVLHERLAIKALVEDERHVVFPQFGKLIHCDIKVKRVMSLIFEDLLRFWSQTDMDKYIEQRCERGLSKRKAAKLRERCVVGIPGIEARIRKLRILYSFDQKIVGFRAVPYKLTLPFTS